MNSHSEDKPITNEEYFKQAISEISSCLAILHYVRNPDKDKYQALLGSAERALKVLNFNEWKPEEVIIFNAECEKLPTLLITFQAEREKLPTLEQLRTQMLEVLADGLDERKKYNPCFHSRTAALDAKPSTSAPILTSGKRIN